LTERRRASDVVVAHSAKACVTTASARECAAEAVGGTSWAGFGWTDVVVSCATHVRVTQAFAIGRTHEWLTARATRCHKQPIELKLLESLRKRILNGHIVYKTQQALTNFKSSTSNELFLQVHILSILLPHVLEAVSYMKPAAQPVGSQKLAPLVEHVLQLLPHAAHTATVGVTTHSMTTYQSFNLFCDKNFSKCKVLPPQMVPTFV
jgi:hypothetical protein